MTTDQRDKLLTLIDDFRVIVQTVGRVAGHASDEDYQKLYEDRLATRQRLIDFVESIT